MVLIMKSPAEKRGFLLLMVLLKTNFVIQSAFGDWHRFEKQIRSIDSYIDHVFDLVIRSRFPRNRCE